MNCVLLNFSEGICILETLRPPFPKFVEGVVAARGLHPEWHLAGYSTFVYGAFCCTQMRLTQLFEGFVYF